MRINSVFFALSIIILMIIPFKGISQVKSINQKLSNLNPRYRFAKTPKVINVSKDDIKQLLKQDSIESKEGYPFRFGKGIKVDIDFFSDASIHSKGDTTFYYYEIKSPSAFSINLIFDHLKLNDNSYLNIYKCPQGASWGKEADAVTMLLLDF